MMEKRKTWVSPEKEKREKLILLKKNLNKDTKEQLVEGTASSSRKSSTKDNSILPFISSQKTQKPPPTHLAHFKIPHLTYKHFTPCLTQPNVKTSSSTSTTHVITTAIIATKQHRHHGQPSKNLNSSMGYSED